MNVVEANARATLCGVLSDVRGRVGTTDRSGRAARSIVKVLGFGSSDDRFVGRLTRAAVHSFAALGRHGAVRPQETGSVKGSAAPEGGHCSGRARVLLRSESSHAAALGRVRQRISPSRRP